MRLPGFAVLLALLSACSGATSDIGSRPRGDGGTNEAGEKVVTSSSTAPREVPQSSFTGARGGCSNIFAYRASADRTQYAVIEVDKEALGLEIRSNRTVDLGKNPEGVRVFVDVYAGAVEGATAYCTDYGDAQPAMTRWTAEAGKLTIELSEDPDSIDAKHPTYRVTLHLETAHFVRPEHGAAIVVPNVDIEEVRAGWLPG